MIFILNLNMTPDDQTPILMLARQALYGWGIYSVLIN